MTSLLEKAMAVEIKQRNRKAATPEEVDLALAWARSEVSSNQASIAIGCKVTNRGSLYCFLSSRLKEAVQQGRLVETPKGV